MKKAWPLSILLLFASAATYADDNDKLLQQLDNVLDNVPTYELHKELRIQELKNQAAILPSNEQKYWLLRDLLNEYSVFDADSALAYGERALAIANDIGRQDLVNDIHILNSYTLAATGLLQQSRQELNMVDLSCLDEMSKVDYWGQEVYLSTHESQYKNVNNETRENLVYAKNMLDSIASCVEKNHPNYYYHIGYHAMSQGGSVANAIDLIAPAMENRKYDTREDARLAWVLSQLYKLEDDKENQTKYLILSAIADARTANRDIASLEELSQIMQEQGDLDRAYNYIDHTLQSAELLQNRVRVLHVAMLQREISKLYQQRANMLKQQREFFLIIMGVLILVLIFSIVYILRQRGTLDKSNERLAEVNEELKSRLQELSSAYSQLASNNQKLVEISDQLRTANERLAESDYVKVKCIGNIFSNCSTYINKLDDFRKQMLRKLKARQYDEARALADSPELTQNELKEFYTQFDAIFLSVYPDFVSDFNSLLPESEQISVKSPESLNTDLRIYALVRLGIADSVGIAAVLHCSPQTIYNKRQRIRNLTGLSKEKLVNIVRNLGKANLT